MSSKYYLLGYPMFQVLLNAEWSLFSVISTCLIYLDDIIVFGITFEQHIERLREVLSRIKEAGLKLKPIKCTLFQKSVLFLGHTVSEEGITTNPEKTEALNSWPAPTSVTEVMSFLGFCSNYRKFIRNFSLIARPLSKLTSKTVKFRSPEECQEAFQELKNKLLSAPIMSFPNEASSY